MLNQGCSMPKTSIIWYTVEELGSFPYVNKVIIRTLL